MMNAEAVAASDNDADFTDERPRTEGEEFFWFMGQAP
jgi:hypothetical protein